jgi:hypothetical protein
MPEIPSGGRHRRRRTNRLVRADLDEARRAGLVQRHLAKLRYLAERSQEAPEPATPDAASPPVAMDVQRDRRRTGTPPSTVDAA